MFGPKRLPSLLNSLKHSNYPRLDIIVMNGSYRIEAAVPGVEPNDIKVEILPGNGSERLLKISGRMAKDYLYSNDVN
jgi:HSP20 family molecular chaperone IbpA